MKKYSSELFGSIDEPENFVELLELIGSTPTPDERLVMMWRGQADVRWSIDSAAVRRLRLEGDKSVTENQLIQYEKRLLKRATHKGFRDFNGINLSDFDLLARLQRHGAATRLVDATRNALVALYFCCNDLPKTYGSLLGFHTDYLGGYESEPKEEPYDKVVSGLEKFEHPQTWEPPAITARISAQRSQFLYSALSNSKIGTLRIDQNKNALKAIALSPAMKRICLRRIMETFDIHLLSLFPDIDGFGRANSPAVRQWDNDRW